MAAPCKLFLTTPLTRSGTCDRPRPYNTDRPRSSSVASLQESCGRYILRIFRGIGRFAHFNPKRLLNPKTLNPKLQTLMVHGVALNPRGLWRSWPVAHAASALSTRRPCGEKNMRVCIPSYIHACICIYICICIYLYACSYIYIYVLSFFRSPDPWAKDGGGLGFSLAGIASASFVESSCTNFERIGSLLPKVRAAAGFQSRLMLTPRFM